MKRFVISIIGCLIIFSCAGQRPENIGVSIGRLTDCPARPNCVSSQAADNEHAIAPFRYHGEKKDAFNRLKKIIASFERMTIVAENDRYIHIECTSSIMRFIDDLEFSFLEEKEITEDQHKRLLNIAGKCPVAKMVKGETQIETSIK